MRTRWISPQFVSTNRVDSVADYQQVREMGQRVVEALGIGTSATHMEWFFGPKGLKFSEIGCRPPGVGAWDLYSAGNDLDLYREWANAIVHGHGVRPALATVLLRHRRAAPERDGHICGYSGVDEIQGRHGEWVIDAHFPNPGTPTQPPRGRATSPTPTSGCGTPTSTSSARCSTTSAGPSPCTPREPPGHAAGSAAPPARAPRPRGPRSGGPGGHRDGGVAGARGRRRRAERGDGVQDRQPRPARALAGGATTRTASTAMPSGSTRLPSPSCASSTWCSSTTR